MSKLWHRIRCFFNEHRWEEKRIDGERAFECRDCHKRNFGPQPEDPPVIRGPGDGGISSGVGPGM